MDDLSEDAQLPPPSSPTPWPSTKLPLALLAPETVTTSPAFVEGIVSLLWPFSPSSATLSLLVCEEDVRLRSSKGQLRVNFYGASARDVDFKKVQIGDRVQLSLEGAELEVRQDPTSRDVPWSVVFSTRLLMRFKNTTVWHDIDVNCPEETVPTSFSTIPDDEYMYAPIHMPVTPPKSHPNPNFAQTSESQWSAPGAFKRKGDLLENSPLYLQRLFSDEEYDLDTELERPWKRPRFSSSYRLVDRTPSLEPESGAEGSTDPFASGPSRGDIEAVRLASMTDGSLTVFRDPPSPNPVPSGRPTQVDMPPPPLPTMGSRQDDEQAGEIPGSPSLRPVPSPQLPLVSPFLHQGLSEEDYMSIDTGIASTEFEIQDVSIKSPVTIAIESPTPVKEPLHDPISNIVEDGASPPALSLASESSRPTSDGESERDSLFDEMPDREDTRPCARSRSPLPGPSPLRKVERAKTPERAPSKRLNLNLQITTSPLQQLDMSRSTPKTPHLYLPTPSPKINMFEHSGFQFTTPPRLDFGARSLSSLGNTGDETAREQKRKVLRQSLDSAPTDLSTYFGRLEQVPEQSRNQEIATEELNAAEVVVTSRNGDLQEATRVQIIQFKSGITTPLSDFPPLAFLSWGTIIDVIGVVCQHSPIARAESGQKDYYTTVRIVDSSRLAGIIMRLFRPYEDALPEVDTGDVVMLRSFKITSYKHKFMGISTENSAWAVWKDEGKRRPAVCAGPPVEYGTEEEQYVDDIGAWYAGLDAKTRGDMEGKPREELVVSTKNK